MRPSSTQLGPAGYRAPLKILRVFRPLQGLWRMPIIGAFCNRSPMIDPFGRTAERRMERRLLADYETLLEDLCRYLNSANHAVAIDLARLPEQIRGFGHVKEANIARAEAAAISLQERWRDMQLAVQPAE